MALLFRLEQRHSPGELKELVTEVADWFRRHEGYERLQALFTELIRESCAVNNVSLSGFSNSLEVKTMSLAETIGEWKQEWLAEGKVQGTADALIALLAGKFGAIEPSWREQIRKAELATLEHWFKRAINAPDLPSVFNPPSRD